LGHHQGAASRQSSRQSWAEGRERDVSLPSASLHRFATLTAISTLFLIVAGALVVGNEAGLAVPDWPLSFGTWMPPMEGGVFYEHGHRMVATTVGALTTILALWLWRREPRRWVRRLGWLALAAVVVQGVLGGITVLYRLPAPVSITHACLAQLFFCLAVSLALFTGRSWNSQAEPIEDRDFPAFRHLCAAASAGIFVQLILGASLRHRVLTLVPHLVWALVVTGLVGWLAVRAMRIPEQKPLQRLALTLGILLILQLALGGVSYLARRTQENFVQPEFPVIWTTTAHVATGALALGTSWVLTLLAFLRSRPFHAVAHLRGTPQKSPA
jgi:cytochrome c oxidase assembly protein subunit 15